MRIFIYRSHVGDKEINFTLYSSTFFKINRLKIFALFIILNFENIVK